MTVLGYYPQNACFKVGEKALGRSDLEQSLSENPEACIPVQPEQTFRTLGDEPDCTRYASLLIDREPKGIKAPGLVIKHKEQLQVLVRLDRSARTDVETWQKKVVQQLAKFGCKAVPANTVPLAARVNDPFDAGAIDPWVSRFAFRTWDDLLKIDPQQDEDALINPSRRFLCRGGSFLIVAPSGVGKSTLVMQMAASWALGEPFFGIGVKGPLKCVLLQAENDAGDIAEMAQGVAAGMQLAPKKRKKKTLELLKKNLVVHSQFDFDSCGDLPEALQQMIDLHAPDVCFVDPLFAFVRGDFNSQEVGSEVFRRRIDPILKKSGCILVSTHHTPKPARENSRYGGVDFSYAGYGTSELTNWHRAVATLKPEKGQPNVFRFIVAKRGSRAGFPGGLNYCLMKHSENTLYWDKVKPGKRSKAAEEKTKKEQTEADVWRVAYYDGTLSRPQILARIQAAWSISTRQSGHYWNSIKDRYVQYPKTKYTPKPEWFPAALQQQCAQPGLGANAESSTAQSLPVAFWKAVNSNKALTSAQILGLIMDKGKLLKPEAQKLWPLIKPRFTSKANRFTLRIDDVPSAPRKTESNGDSHRVVKAKAGPRRKRRLKRAK
jgi:RecA-family ATPase